MDEVLSSGVPLARALRVTSTAALAVVDAAGAPVPAQDATTVNEGLGALERRARSRHGKPFVALSATEQDALLREVEMDDDGREWMGVMVVLTLEALLGDPVYGGNHEERGWKWLGLEPPAPRPSRRWSEGT